MSVLTIETKVNFENANVQRLEILVDKFGQMMLNKLNPGLLLFAKPLIKSNMIESTWYMRSWVGGSCLGSTSGSIRFSSSAKDVCKYDDDDDNDEDDDDNDVNEDDSGSIRFSSSAKDVGKYR